jgi:cytochrome c peroxidase
MDDLKMLIRIRRRAIVPLTLLAAIGLTVSVIIAAAQQLPTTELASEPVLPLPEVPVLDATRVALGEELFNDPILSGKRKLACSSCHELSKGGTVPLPRTVGYNGRMHRFNAPSIFNVANNYRLGWRGNFTRLDEQNDAVIVDPNLMASEWPALLAALNSSKHYSKLFGDIYGHQIRKLDVLDALVTFQRSLSTPNARFDRFLRGDKSALSDLELNGYRMFKSYGCTSCHQGRNIGGNLFEKFGVFADAYADTDTGTPAQAVIMDDGDLGRFTITHAEEDKGVFRVPSLRNVALTAPYFHDGRIWSLASAVRIMSKLQLGHDIPTDDIDAIVAFLQTLNGEYKGRELGNDK